jgi:hypothetical protein
MTKNKWRLVVKVVRPAMNVFAMLCRGVRLYTPAVRFGINGVSMLCRGAACKQAKLRLCAPTVNFAVNGILGEWCRGEGPLAPTVNFGINLFSNHSKPSWQVSS